jgi:hypothetical protein
MYFSYIFIHLHIKKELVLADSCVSPDDVHLSSKHEMYNKNKKQIGF